ncbi:hypothetical protein [Paenibacillus thiaminolyticus]|uniref:Uncharacterized protein n=1 Tax=Paenibacillus thiaminolyticus TaxID=49283 RepID=A0A3A3GCB5_PANTH|nr:hypothetical protein [Paenibacillus thiaminolyticus]RJG21324.1 hypothetical protein DQX05_21720 [Paenibacillus thiaminolyticus]
MWDIFMWVAIGVVAFLLYRGINDKPMLPGISKRNKKKSVAKPRNQRAKKLDVSFQELIGVKQMFGNLIELESDIQDVRTFVGAVKCEPINYALRAHAEQKETDQAYEHLLASLSLGPGREVCIGTHICSRPIELDDQMKPYYDTFDTLDPVAQHYAQSLFFPFIEDWQKSVEEYDYDRYFLIPLEYTQRMIGDMDEETLLVKVRNEFNRLASNVISNYGSMGGISEICSEEQLYEALYFATHKKTGNQKQIRKILDAKHALSPIVMSDYSRNSYRYVEGNEEELIDAEAISQEE